jgi:ribonuclease Z
VSLIWKQPIQFRSLMTRFPAPRYASSSPYPSILSESSPFPSPVPYPLKAPYDDIKPLPLSAPELHMRIIVQAIASQVDQIWSERQASAPCATVLARDFMVMQVPGHELNAGEVEIVEGHLRETTEVAAAWQEVGGVYIPERRGKRWIGLDPEPSSKRD